MCIILNEIVSVNATKIFVAPDKSKTKQFTVYKNTVDSPAENMMILPVPHPESLQLHTPRYGDLFDDLFKSVSRIPSRSSSRGESLSYSATRSIASILPVFDYGSYKVSIAPSLEDLFRLDTTVFDLPDGIEDFFATHYNKEFGYLCCKLKPGKQEYEPVCYSHTLHSSGKLFVPTLHYHVHSNHTDTDAADWDHFVYSVGTTPIANLEFTSNPKNQVVWAKFPEAFRHTQTDPIRLARITGHFKNHDLSFVLS